VTVKLGFRDWLTQYGYSTTGAGLGARTGGAALLSWTVTSGSWGGRSPLPSAAIFAFGAISVIVAAYVVPWLAQRALRPSAHLKSPAAERAFLIPTVAVTLIVCLLAALNAPMWGVAALACAQTMYAIGLAVYFTRNR
jgi:hypothetical protein